ncbi:acyl-CoA dehydrogenase family protein [Roseomonas populi]|uniref:Acyl-CoA dehydrogenase family protein n=1 Tax=Roseomonas populi TaxID=3121582 RepID=A0ABT1WZ24_9PROT|nr:acyl-CoA dehydrogenase family protein [Roseomonas pecuniae]MCR0981074.1 acyl-CoA dehydrogenase family protein [Roseomonas pecuniae]
MPFTAPPLFPGDLFEGAARLAASAEGRLSAVSEAPARAAVLDALWEEAAALGWPAVMVPEAQEGAGGTLEDLVAILDGAGRAALPLPLAAACGVVPAMLPAEAGGVVLPFVASGEWRVAPAFAELMRDPRSPAAAAATEGGVLRLSGSVIGMEAPPGATHTLLHAPVDGASGLILLPLDEGGPGLRRFERLDGRPSLDVLLDGVTLPGTALLARGEAVARAAASARALGTLLVMVEAVAAMGALVGQTIEYLSTRVQFGETLSRFQVLRHGTVDLYTRHEAARALVVSLVTAAAETSVAELDARTLHLAKLHVGRAAREVAEGAIQLHGGMGLTDELPASRLTKRLLCVEFDYGDGAVHAALAA